MNAIILCPGPSLANYIPRPADLVITVNRAALTYSSDYWAALDYPMVRDNAPKVLGNPGLLSRGQTVADLRPQWIERFKEIRVIEELALPERLKSPLTAEAAVIFAACWKGANHISVYGSDWTGTKDFDGTEAGEDRTEDRWARERKNWGQIILPFLSERKVVVERL